MEAKLSSGSRFATTPVVCECCGGRIWIRRCWLIALQVRSHGGSWWILVMGAMNWELETWLLEDLVIDCRLELKIAVVMIAMAETVIVHDQNCRGCHGCKEKFGGEWVVLGFEEERRKRILIRKKTRKKKKKKGKNNFLLNNYFNIMSISVIL